MIQVVSELEQELNLLKEEVKLVFDLDETIVPDRVPHDLTLNQMLILQSTYLSLVFALHSGLTYPWSFPLVSLRGNPSLYAKAQALMTKAAAAAKLAILGSTMIHVDANCPLG